jgi:hypothetical protein
MGIRGSYIIFCGLASTLPPGWHPEPDSIAYYSMYSQIYTPFSVNGVINLTWRYCGDCTYYGGTNQKPDYWPN